MLFFQFEEETKLRVAGASEVVGKQRKALESPPCRRYPPKTQTSFWHFWHSVALTQLGLAFTIVDGNFLG